MYSPVFKLVSLCILLLIGAILDLEIHQMDVKTAFLNGEIDTEVYVKQPEGFNEDKDRVCKLCKSLYSLKQSPRLWNNKINTYLIKNGFERCKNDKCIYNKHGSNGIILIG